MSGQRYTERRRATEAVPAARSQGADQGSSVRSPSELDARVLAAARAAVAPGLEPHRWLAFARRHPWAIGLSLAGALALALAFGGTVLHGPATGVSEIISSER